MKDGYRNSRHALLHGSAMLLALCSTTAFAQNASTSASADDDQRATSEIVVTATRRDMTVQSAPINIAAVGGDQIQSQGLTNLRTLTQLTPGVYIPETGPRASSLIVFRGLNSNPLGLTEYSNGGGGTVATYVGEVPLYIDLRLNDIERVEFLAGPQGTLYGAGTLGGAIRYIPKRAQFDRISGEVRGNVYGYTHGSSVSTDLGATLNLPVSETFALRGSIDRLNDRGFVDQPFIVRQIGVSDPDPDFTNPAAVNANLRRAKDVNTNETLSGRLAARWKPSDAFDANLTYYYQRSHSDGRQASNRGLTNFPVPIGKYEIARRTEEPNTRTNQLLSLEMSADLDFAQLTSSTGRSWYRDHGNRDQTDLLIGLEYGYELFPSFAMRTREDGRQNRFIQELRLVSKSDGPFSWIFGGFYSRAKTFQSSKEFTPGYSEYLFSLGQAAQIRPDSLEYINVIRSRLTEMAAYGELSYKVTPEWQVTVGGRYYDYKLRTQLATDLPLFKTITGRAGPNDIILNFTPGGQSDNGFLYKVNTSYKFSPDALVYATYSQGYRIGNSNATPACPTPLPANQIVCALPNELEYKPDKTINYEIGAKTQWFDRRLTLNVAAYYIKWKNPQISSVTQNGFQGITINGGGAETKGVELMLAGRPTDRLSMRFSYAYTDPQLTKETPRIIPFITPPGFQNTIDYEDGQPGDRLPGSPRHTASVNVEYAYPLGDGLTLTGAYLGTGQSNVETRIGGRAGSYTIKGFTRHDLSLALDGESWTVTAYVNNVFNKYAESGASFYPPAYNQVVKDAGGGNVYVRSFFTYILPPRQFGLRFSKRF
ncbi:MULTISPECIES: TonB-dependent receptor [unclassified Sphingomonas]|uniref:TonB-dependent receptor n=1 Tax=unclassified Sphingomonas TaxID=196159 RepID=UPI0006FED613|nr:MULTISPECIES: TonB-dependent receptor [unclassified Sphingomonas]KQX25974.1 hypothetical protein ASD17_00430 [Sphingomonas sp. Root1294]KQY69039.1 hypothetical protein ASD39_01625 [Sphingomonas sp. Root50]KRB89294.1 hypothetical protein ASE22_16540 [Sphingomonas sp. Root720]